MEEVRAVNEAGAAAVCGVQVYLKVVKLLGVRHVSRRFRKSALLEWLLTARLSESPPCSLLFLLLSSSVSPPSVLLCSGLGHVVMMCSVTCIQPGSRAPRRSVDIRLEEFRPT